MNIMLILISKIPINPNPKFTPKLEFIQKKLEQISSKV